MSRRKKLLKAIVLTTLVCALLVGCSSLTLVKDEYFIIWKDADGTLIEYATVDSKYDPSFKELPPDTDQWQYTGWSVAKSGNRTECTAQRIKKIKIQWTDPDGNILKEEHVTSADAANISHPLPDDTDEWHYTEWIKTATSDGFAFHAKRIPKEKYVWKDADGSVLKEEYIVEGQEAPTMDLPSGDEKWEYIEWDSSNENGEHIFTAVKTPNASYFAGNVFQIVIKDPEGTLLGTGSGFVINDEGWFITNNHVMEKASTAVAFFDIKDQESGSRYTQLNVLGGVYNSSEIDIFIGKLEGYDKIKAHYKNIEFTEDYTSGEISYTVGYPNSSVKMEINSGEILEEYSDIYDKVNGIYYILSDSYIAPGSSGGILTNENFEVIGITTIGLYADDNKQIYQAGGSVPTFVFSSHLKKLEEANLKTLTEIYNYWEMTIDANEND